MDWILCTYGEGSVSYQFPLRNEPIPDFNANRLVFLDKPEEGLTGLVRGMKASDIEERFARALYKYQIPFDFQVSYLAPRNMSGEYRLDFMVYFEGEAWPFAIDGEYAHKTASQKRKDVWKDTVFDNAKKGKYRPVTRVPFTELDTQEKADNFIKGYLLWQQ